MKLKTSYRKDIGNVNGLEIEVFEMPKPCRNCAYPAESIFIEEFKYAVMLIVFRHEKETELLLRIEAADENNVAVHNRIILAKEVSNKRNYLELEVSISDTGRNENFRISNFPHNNEEYIEKDNIIYKIKSIQYFNNCKYSISVTTEGDLPDFLKRWGLKLNY